ncbi:MAG: protein translocase subunit SecF [Thermotogota bacterium]|nr:protein translocase subunit SecF [Thermotogota bacterium]
MKQFNFVNKRKIFIMISLIVIAVALIFIFSKSFNFGVDFTGGTEISLTVSNVDTTVGEVREHLVKENELFESARIVKQRPLAETLEGETVTKARFSVIVAGETAKKLEEIIVKALSEPLGVKSDDIVSVNTISGFAAQEIKGYMTTAVIVAVALVLLYITIRFRFVFGLGALLALIHDLVIVLGLYSIFGIEFNAPVIAALLTLLGYSLNDTIVVYDRIRENLKKLRGKPITEIVNSSINEVIIRSINTSLTTFIAVLVLYIFSGEVLQPFAFGILAGVIVGTYSSLYIAPPIIITWIAKRGRTL